MASWSEVSNFSLVLTTRLLDFKLELRTSFSPDGSDGDTMVFRAELVIGKGFSVGQLRSQQCVVRSWTYTSSSERWMRRCLSLWTVVGRFSCTTETPK